MQTYTPDTEVDFIVIGSGAAGGIMAKQLSTAGFSVVVLEQGGWGKYGHEQDYTKDELLNDNPATANMSAVRNARYLVIPFPAAEPGIRSVPATLDLARQLSELGLAP